MARGLVSRGPLKGIGALQNGGGGIHTYMMKKYLIKGVCVKGACLGALALACVMGVAACRDNPDVTAKVDAARARNDGPPIWKVTAPDIDAGGQLYVYGALHILPQDLDWKKPDLEGVLTGAGTVFFEAPRDENALLRADVIRARDGFYSAGVTLPDKLDGYNRARLFAAVINAGLKDGALDSYQPWLAADVLALSALEAAGLTGGNGADAVIFAQASAQGKYIRYLETMDEHLGASVILPERLQIQELVKTLDDLDSLAEHTHLLNTAWASGNARYIDEVLLEPLRAKAPEYYEALFARRNAAWSTLLTPFVTDGGNGLAVVGIGHLLGEGSLIEQLELSGLTVERYYAHRGENVIKTIDLDMGR